MKFNYHIDIWICLSRKYGQGVMIGGGFRVLFWRIFPRGALGKLLLGEIQITGFIALI